MSPAPAQEAGTPKGKGKGQVAAQAALPADTDEVTTIKKEQKPLQDRINILSEQLDGAKTDAEELFEAQGKKYRQPLSARKMCRTRLTISLSPWRRRSTSSRRCCWTW